MIPLINKANSKVIISPKSDLGNQNIYINKYIRN